LGDHVPVFGGAAVLCRFPKTPETFNHITINTCSESEPSHR
jgi:hypothetical protein